MIDKLLEFTRTYHSALEAVLEARGREHFPYHGEPTPIVSIFIAADGYATFYLPAPPDGKIESGYYVFDYSQHSLDTICQSLSIHRLKVASPRIGERWDAIEPVPPNVEPIPGLPGSWFHENVRQLVIAGKLNSLQGMTISPIVHFEDGILSRVVPARIAIWSPTFEFPDIGRERLYLWTHADFWWLPEKLDFDPNGANLIAENDLLALRATLNAFPALPEEIAQNGTSATGPNILDGYCDEFLELLLQSGDREEVLHQWLKNPDHHIFLDPHQVRVWSKTRFGNKEIDFVILRSDGTYVLVEIERADKRIFQRYNNEPTAEFNHACQQVRDCQRFIRDNVHTVREEQGFQGIYEPKGMVVIGRSQDIEAEEARTRWRDMKGTWALDLATYDELCERVRALATSIRNSMLGSQ